LNESGVMGACEALFLPPSSGAAGEPFAEDIMDVVDTIGQWMGYATNSKRWQFLRAISRAKRVRLNGQ
jgi:hypothetical protein